MSLLDQASLVLVPSAIKTGEVLVQKPLPTKFSDETGNYDGNDPTTNANLTFTRNSNATRVNADGKVEKVRQNLVLESNSFSTAPWTVVAAIVTSGQTGYDGTSNAWLLTKTNSSGRVNQTISTLSSASNTLSVYVKANASTWCAIEYGTSYRYLNLSTGAVSTGSGDYNVQSLANGWYRFSINSSSAAGTFRIYPAEADNISATSGSIFIQASQAETGDIATDYIPTTTSARSTFAGISVDGTSVPNVPRLDYSGGATCGKLLLEPQRTNAIYPSEDYSNYMGTGSTVSINAAISPDGYQNADKIIATSSSNQHNRFTTFSYTGASSYSVYFKAAGYNYGQIYGGGSAPNRFSVVVNLTNGTIDTYDNISESQIQITAMGNGWYRVAVNGFSATATFVAIAPIQSSGLARNANMDIFYTGDNASGIYAWGLQVETNATYASSYIPTLGASVTRLADAAYKTGISSLIGQTEGTIFFEGSILDTSSTNRALGVSDGTGNNRIFFNATPTLEFRIISGGVTSGVLNGPSVTANTTFKVAMAYANNDMTIYYNGSLVGSDSSVTIPACTDFRFDSGSGTSNFLGNTSQALLFKTRLTNAQLAELTTL